MKTNTSKSTSSDTADDGEDTGNDLHDLFIDELADILNAEQQLTTALPGMAKAAKSQELREAFESHLRETENQVARLEQAFKLLGEQVKSKPCKAMKGLLEEGDQLMKELEGSTALDAGLIAAAQKVEHYEIASYGTVCTWAEQMGHTDALELLEESLAEEKATDEKLTAIAVGSVNGEAEDSEGREESIGRAK